MHQLERNRTQLVVDDSTMMMVMLIRFREISLHALTHAHTLKNHLVRNHLLQRKFNDGKKLSTRSYQGSEFKFHLK